MCHRWLARYRKRFGEVRAVFQNAADHAAARIARPDLDEGLHPRRVGSANHARKIHRGQRLRFNRIRSGVGIGRVGTAPGGAVKLDIRRRGGGRVVQRAIPGAHRMRQLAMHRAHALQCKPVATQCRDHLIDLAAVTTDHAFIRAVDDEHIHALACANRSTHRVNAAIDHAGDPLDRLLRRQVPAAAQYIRHAGQIMGKQRRSTQTLQHRIALAPGTQREQRGRFAQAVADGGSGGDAEAHREISHHRAERDLAANQRAMVSQRRRG